MKGYAMTGIRMMGRAAAIAAFAAFMGLALFMAPGGAWAAPEGSPDEVLARVEGQEIRAGEIEMVLQSMGPQGAMMYDNPQGRQAILDELVSMQLFALEAVKDKLNEAPEFKAAVENFRKQALARAGIEKILNAVSVSEEEAKKFYDANPDQFTRPERVHLRHILVSDDVASADQIAKIQADLKAGVSFDEIARNVSTCPSAPQGGDLGEVSRGQMVPEFEAAGFALKNPGDVSEPVKTQFGWHIIRLEGRVPESVEPFDVVKAQLLQYLTNEKRNEAFMARVEELKKVYKVEILAPASADLAPVSADAEPKK